MSNKYQDWLRNHGLKATKNRMLMLEILDVEHNFLSAEEIYNALKSKSSNLSLSTVYRSMESLIDVGLVAPVNLETSKQTLYELSHTEHAHHLICLNCQKIIHVHGCPVGSYEKQVTKDHGFIVKEHKLELYGYCEACQN